MEARSSSSGALSRCYERGRHSWRASIACSGGGFWAMLYGIGGYALGDNVHRFSGVFARVTIGLAALLIVVGVLWLRRNERRLEATAERELPGPLDAYVGRKRRHTAATAAPGASDT